MCFEFILLSDFKEDVLVVLDDEYPEKYRKKECTSRDIHPPHPVQVQVQEEGVYTQ